MNNKTYPTTINLKELKLEGETFIYSQATTELNSSLSDLIHGRDYSAELHLRPMGNAFEISGKIKTTLEHQCARCGRDMTSPVDESFIELIVVMDVRPRAGHSGHTGTIDNDSAPYCNYMSTYQLNLAEFVREHVAAAEPYAPHCDRSDCEDYLKSIQMLANIPESDLQIRPFEILKNIQVKGQRS